MARYIAAMRTRPVAVYASPLERTRETAAPISRALRLRTRIDRGLLECDFGDWTGKKLAVLSTKKEWRTVQHAPSTFRFPGGESFAEMQTRIWSTMERLAAAHRGKTIVLVSHADPIKAAVTYAQGPRLAEGVFAHEGTNSSRVPVLFTLSTTGTLDELVPS